MSENPRIRIPFGDSLDREAGLMVMRPGSMEDMRNVVLHEGSVTIRAGFGSPLALLDDDGEPMTHILQGHALRSSRNGVVVAYKEVNVGPVRGRVYVFEINANGDTYEFLGEWEHDQGGWGGISEDESVAGSVPPVISMAESYGKVFMAHDELSITARAQTIYYDPDDGELHGLYNDFTFPYTESEGGDTPTRFRGVCRHLNYLVGWGYGSDAEDRPELVRTSLPGSPTLFNREHYAIVGNRRDPVLRCISCGDRLGVLKEAEGYPFVGSSRDDFGVSPVPVDPLFGVQAGALAVNFGGMVMAWSAEGPRLWDFSGPSKDIAMPLDLLGPQPAGLAEASEVARGFACYIPEQRIVAFVFGQRVYAFSVRNENEPRWAGYWELDEAAYCAFTLYTGQQLSSAPGGYPAIDTNPADGEVDTYDAAGTYVDVTVKNVRHAGDEIIEAWLKEEVESGEGDWGTEPWARFPVGPGATTPIRIEGLTPGSDYTLAVRYKRGLLYNKAYQSETPETPPHWPSVSVGTFQTSIDPPLFVSGVWARTAADAEKITLTLTPAVDQEDNDIDIYRDGEYLATIAGPHTGNVTYEDENFFDTESAGYDELDREEPFHYTARTIGESAIESIDSDTLDVWPGPAGFPTFGWILSRGSGYEVGSGTVVAGRDVDVWDDYNDAGGHTAFAPRFTIATGDYTGASGALTGLTVPLLIDVQLRYSLTQFGVEDFGELGTGAYAGEVTLTPGGYDE
jgi:hypothetical protein